MQLDSEVIDPRVRKYIVPKRLVFQEGVKNAECLTVPGSGQASGGARPGALFSTKGSVILDFGREIHGGVQFLTGWTDGPRKKKVRIRFGESVSETMGEPNNDHSTHDTELELPPMGWCEYGCTAFRFIKVDLLSPDFVLDIKEIRAISLMRDLKWKGSFECSDERLNEIWKVGAYTVQLCLQDYLWDGAKRDRMVWMGDMHPEIMTTASAFGHLDVIENSLDLVRDEAPMPQHMNGIGSYSLWWIIAQRDWFLFNGSKKYLEAQKSYLEQLLNLALDTMVGPDGVECMPGRRFLDWPTNDDNAAKHAGLQALLVMAFDAGADLCALLKLDELGGKCRKTAAKMRAVQIPDIASKQVNALKVLAGISDAKATNKAFLANDPLHGVSTFYGYYVLQARAKAGDIQGCLELIRKYWGAMLDLGSTTFWEHFELDWMENAGRIDELPVAGKHDVHAEYGAYCFVGLRHSLCHGWASGPTAWLSEHVLGVKVLEPGTALVSIKPELGDLEWVRGRFPTPHGEIEIEHRRGKDGKIESKIKLPKGVRTE